ncbi:hypothetical protein L8S13_01995 [Vibrio lentus]|uniref:TRAFAC clade GTPase domain-containing protein n=1 Tax=Vibrio lentus TaxID=136468 RepID=UPI0024696F34|nr:hypothetical protein [Vibrio lentus]MDH5925055.1 hypothetical protein [Vibrio lentus]
MLTPEIILLGGPNSGKTHYAGQFYGRLQRNPGKLKLRKDQSTPSDLSALEGVLKRLENGNSADHTPTETWSEITLPLVDAQGRHIELIWPDYAGEQLKEVFNNREVPASWRQRLIGADGWFVLIRLNSETIYPDALEQLASSDFDSSRSVSRVGNWDANSYWIETLQILGHVAGISATSKRFKPRLAILLSCYDELETENLTPVEVLRRKLPLLESFIDSNWDANAVSIWGLSSLGKELKIDTGDDDFIDEGPECQGWVINPEGGVQDSDLSKPLAWLLDKTDD